MALVNALRLSRIAKNFFGVRGPYSLELSEGVTPVIELGRFADPTFDDTAYYWVAASGQVAVAGQFSFITLFCNQGRAVVDGLMWAAPQTVQTLRVARSLLGGGAAVALRGPSAVPGTVLSSTSLVVNAGSQVADPAAALLWSLPDNIAQVAPITFGGPFPQVITQGESLLFSPAPVNNVINVIAWGRLYPNFPE